MPGLLVVRPTQGLCNRLWVIASFGALARRSGRELRICFAESSGWSRETWPELFATPLPLIPPGMYDALTVGSLRLEEEVTVEGTGGLSQRWRVGDSGGVRALWDHQRFPVVSYKGTKRGHELIPPEERRRLVPGIRREFAARLRALEPAPDIGARVDELTAGFGKTIGVHVRRGDAFHHPFLAEQYARSSDEAFFRRLDQLARAGRATFFLATDDPETQDRFRERYGEGVIVNERKRFVPSRIGEAKDNQRDALIDLLALARTERVIGSYYSTFSQTAALIGGIRLEVALADSRKEIWGRRAAYARHELARRGRIVLGRS